MRKLRSEKGMNLPQTSYLVISRAEAWTQAFWLQTPLHHAMCHGICRIKVFTASSPYDLSWVSSNIEMTIFLNMWKCLKLMEMILSHVYIFSFKAHLLENKFSWAEIKEL